MFVDPLVVAFTSESFSFRFNVSESVSGYVHYRWDYGDGSSPVYSVSPESTHEYTSPGFYLVLIEASLCGQRQEVSVTVMAGSLRLIENTPISGALIVANYSFVLTGQPVLFSASVESGSNVSFVFDFGDGMVVSPLFDSLVSHAFTNPGVYTVILNASNAVSVGLAVCTVLVLDEITGLSLEFASPNAVRERVEFQVSITTGTNVSMTFQVDNITWTFEYEENETTFGHVFNVSGVYCVLLQATNLVSNDEISTEITVQVKVVSITLITPPVAQSGSDIMINVLVDQGSDLTYRWVISSTGQNTTAIDTDEPYYLLTVFDTDVYEVYCLVFNLVSQMASEVSNISVQDAVEGVHLYTNNSTVAVGVDVRIIVTVEVGSDLTYSFDFGDGNVINDLKTREVTHVFNNFGTYRVTVVSFNSISTANASLTLTAQIPVTGLSLDPVQPVNTNASVTLTAFLTGGSDVTILWDFGDQTSTSYLIPFVNHSVLQHLHVYLHAGEYKVNVYASNDLNSQHQSTIVFAAKLLSNFTVTGPNIVATDVNVTFTILDDDDDDVILNRCYTWTVHDSTGLTLHNETNYHQTFVYSFSHPLTYTIKCVLNNKLSTTVALQQVQAHQRIDDVELMLTPSVAVDTETTANVVIGAGTDVSYTFDFGDGDILMSHVAMVAHSYDRRGVFLVIVTLVNPVSQSTVSKEVTVQEVVTGLTISSSSYVSVGRLALLNGSVSQGSNVSFRWDFGNGINQLVEASSLDTQTEAVYHQYGHYTVTLEASNLVSYLSASTTVVAQVEVDDVHLFVPSVSKTGETIEMSVRAMFGSDIAYHCRGLDDNSHIVLEVTPNYGVLNASFSIAGRYTLQCVVYNNVSQVMVSAVVHVYEEIGGVSLLSNRTVVPTGSVVRIAAITETGSDITYTFALGNGLVINATSSQIAHVFLHPGIYHVVVILANLVGFVSTSVDIIVQEETLEVVLVLNRTTLTINESVTLTASCSTGTNVSIMFISGDGFVSTRTPLEGNNVSWMYSYTRPGRYNVTVTAENLVSFVSQSVVVLVEEQVSGLVLSGQHVVETKKNVTFTAVVDKGSNLRYRWTIVETNGMFITNTDDETDLTWIFQATGAYDVTVSVENAVSNAYSHHRIAVQDKIEALSLIRLTDVVSVGQTMRLLISIEKGTNASLFVDYGESTTNIRELIQAGLTYQLYHVYSVVGEYVYSVVAENLVSSVTQQGIVSVGEAVAGLVLLGPNVMETRKYANFTAEIREGTNVRFTWMITGQRGTFIAYEAESQSSEFSWQFQTDGMYNVSVIAKNAGSSDADSRLIVIQHIVSQLSLIGPIAPVSVGQVVSFYISIQNGTNVAFYVYFGDGMSQELRQRPGGEIIRLTHVYNRADRYVCSVHAENLVSSSPVKTTPVTVQESVGTVLLNAFSLGMEGDEPTVFFPVNTIISLLLSVSRGSDLEYLWKTEENHGTYTVSMLPSITHSYSSPGTYNVTVEVHNNVSSTTAKLGLIIQVPVVNMSVQTSKRIVSGEQTEIKIIASTDATHVTCFIDFGDGKTAVIPRVEPSHRVGNQFLLCQVNHTYPIPGTYKLQVVISNHVSSYQDSLQIVVTVSCSNPYVRISSKLEVDPSVGSYQIARSDKFELISQMSVECNGLVRAEYKWTVARVEHDRHRIELPPSVITNTESFYLEGGTLSYGLYEMNVTVSFPDVANDVMTTLSVRVDVKAGDLRAFITGGSRRTVHADRAITLDAQSGSYDPDNPSDTALTYDWSCTLIENSHNNNNTVDCIPDDNPHPGLACLDSMSLLPAQRQGLLRLDAGWLTPNATYVFKVTVKKDRRMSAACKTLMVSAATIPDAFIKCVRNCGSFVNPSYDLVLVGECINCTVGDTVVNIEYYWSILRNGVEIDFDWDEHTTTNRTQGGLVIKGGTFSPDESCTLRLTVTTQASQPGSADFDFTTSSSPQGGTCSVTPTLGYALNTTFTVTCSNWTDESGPVDYYFYYGTGRYSHVLGGEASNLHLESTGSQFLEVNGLFLFSYGTDQSTVLQLLPSGSSLENYTISVVVRITNIHHVSTTFTTEIRVLDAVESSWALLDVMSGMVIVNDSLMDRMTSFGQLRNMVQLCNSIAVTMNKQADEEIERHSRKVEENRQRREEVGCVLYHML